MSRRKDHDLDWMADAYSRGMSYSRIARSAGMTRQSVFDILRRRGVEFRPRGRKIRADEVLRHGGLTYTWNAKGYWRCTTGSRGNLAREIWERANGTKLPVRFKVHFRDGDRTNVAPRNLVAVSDSDFQRQRQSAPEIREMSRAYLCAGNLIMSIMRATDPGLSRGIAAKMWDTRRRRYSPAEISGQAKKAYSTRRRRYGQSGCRDPENAREHMRAGQIGGGTAKMWDMRRKKYGPAGHRHKDTV